MNDTTNNLMPYILQVAVGKINKLSIFSNDYSTVDGIGVRDFIRVTELAQNHEAVLSYLEQEIISNKNSVNQKSSVGFLPIYLGNGKGTSVLELVKAFINVIGKHVPCQFIAHRVGDIASSYASVDKAQTLLGWQAKLSISDMCPDMWHLQSINPNGYA